MRVVVVVLVVVVDVVVVVVVGTSSPAGPKANGLTTAEEFQTS